MSLTLRGDQPMVTAPAVLLIGTPAAMLVASSTSHDVTIAIIGASAAAGVGLGLKWLQWSIKRGVRDVVDEEIKRVLAERDHPRP